MSRTVLVLALVSCAVLPAACRTSPTVERREEVRQGALIDRTVKSYHVVYSANRGKVGYLKVFDVVEGGGQPYEWKYVYDLDFTELGFVDQFGNAYLYKPYTEFEQDIHRRSLRVMRLPADSAERNVMRMLRIDPAVDNVTFPPATASDFRPAAPVPTAAAAPVPAEEPAESTEE